MGTWSASPFDNDDAADFLMELEADPSWSVVRDVFMDVMENADYVELPDGARACAAAALITVATGKCDVSAQDVYMMLDEMGPVPDGLANLAKTAMKRVRTGDSEIRELYLDSGGYVEWLETVQAIEASL
jgi:hypothetical protein